MICMPLQVPETQYNGPRHWATVEWLLRVAQFLNSGGATEDVAEFEGWVAEDEVSEGKEVRPS